MTPTPTLIILAIATSACAPPPPDCPPTPVPECECEEKPQTALAPGEAAIDETPIKLEADGRIILPAPRKDRGLPLMQALSLRRSTRAYSDRKLGLQTLSDLLWAASGINRPDEGKMTAPTAVNYQEIDIYVFIEQGVFLHDRQMHQLTPVLEGDHGDRTGGQPFVKDAPLNLVFVSDTSRMGEMSEESRAFYSATDTGFVSQNVYLFCASEGLGTVVRGMVDKNAVAALLGLGAGQRVVLAQSVGYPGE